MSIIDYTPYKLKEWAPIGPETFWKLSGNPKAIKFLEQNQEHINWGVFLINPQAILLIEKKLQNIDWKKFNLMCKKRVLRKKKIILATNLL